MNDRIRVFHFREAIPSLGIVARDTLSVQEETGRALIMREVPLDVAEAISVLGRAIPQAIMDRAVAEEVPRQRRRLQVVS